MTQMADIVIVATGELGGGGGGGGRREWGEGGRGEGKGRRKGEERGEESVLVVFFGGGREVQYVYMHNFSLLSFFRHTLPPSPSPSLPPSGIPGLIKGHMVKKGAAVIDIGRYMYMYMCL